jgi:hypothetical protein
MVDRLDKGMKPWRYERKVHVRCRVNGRATRPWAPVLRHWHGFHLGQYGGVLRHSHGSVCADVPECRPRGLRTHTPIILTERAVRLQPTVRRSPPRGSSQAQSWSGVPMPERGKAGILEPSTRSSYGRGAGFASKVSNMQTGKAICREKWGLSYRPAKPGGG